MAFLTILTRHMLHRKAQLAFNQASLALQTCQDFEQIVLVDEQRRGFQHAAQMLADAAVHINSAYVLILDDDDVMITADGIEKLQAAAAGMPTAVICKGWHGTALGVLPGVDAWQRRPRLGTIGSFDYIIRSDLFKSLVPDSVAAGYNHDFALIAEVYDLAPNEIVWLPDVICAVTQRSIGQ